MLANVITKKVTSSSYDVNAITRKLAKLDKYFSEDTEAAVTLLEQKNNKKRLELTILYGGTFYRSEIVDNDFLSAVEKAVDVIEGQIRKNKTRLKKRLRDGAFEKAVSIAADDPADDVPVIARTKTFPVHAMDVDEAIMQMNLLSHEFFIFKNASTGNMNVVYRRNDKEYGLLIPVDE